MLLRRRAVLEAVSFSVQWSQLSVLWYEFPVPSLEVRGSLPKVTVADLVFSSVFTSRLVILPLDSTLASAPTY